MIIRYEGGNQGVISYLEKGRKLGQDLHRDQVDSRVILSGDPDLTDSVINSISNKGQARYERIVLSFYENHVSTELLEDIVHDYKNILMSAYDDDEYIFYAEAHLPKLKYNVDRETGELIERKPHIHIVIPNKNLLTGKALNPVGLAKLNIGYLDAIQEHINEKYNLVSPKERLREDQKPILNRVRGDFFNERNQELKERILKKVQDRNVRDMESFKKIIREEGELRVYNKGKDNEYYGVRRKGEKRFTRLKNHFFSKDYIIKRMVKKTNLEGYYNNLVEEWVNKRSLEVRFVNSASKKIREEYNSLSDNKKIEFLKTKREEVRDEIKRIERNVPRRGGGNKKRSPKKLRRGSLGERSNSVERLPSVSKRNVAHGIRGYRKESINLLQDDKFHNLESEESVGERYLYREMRRIQGRGGGLSYVNQKIVEEYGYSKEHISFLKRNINPERFLSYCAINYLVNPREHNLSFSKTGNPRFSVNNRNLNALDFLTKHINLDVDEALDFLQKVHTDEVERVEFKRLEGFGRNQNNKRDWKSYSESKNKVYSCYKEEKDNIYSSYIDSIKGIRERDKDKNEVIKTFYFIRRKQEEERLREKYLNSVRVLKSEFVLFNKVESMDVIKRNIFENLSNGVTRIDEDKINTYEELLKRNKAYLKFESQFKSGAKLGNFVVNKKKDQIDFLDQETKRTVFVDQKGKIELRSPEIRMEDVKALMKYAHDKYNGKLKLTGTKEFKTACALACSQLGLKVVLKPDSYHELMLKENSLRDVKSELTTGRVVTDELTKEFSQKTNNIDLAMEKAKEKIKAIKHSLTDFTFDYENNKSIVNGKEYDLPHYIDNEEDAKNYTSYLRLDIDEVVQEVEREDQPQVEREDLMKGRFLTYDEIKDIHKQDNMQDHLLKIAKNLDGKSKEIYQDEIRKATKIFEATEKIHASNRIKERIYNDTLKDKSDIVYIAKEISKLSEDKKIKGRFNYKDGTLRVNSFKDQDKENVGLTFTFDSKENKGIARINGQSYEFNGMEEFQHKMQDIRMNVDRKVEENKFNRDR